MKIRLGNDVRLKVQLPTDSRQDITTKFKYVTGDVTDIEESIFAGDLVDLNFIEGREYSVEELNNAFGNIVDSDIIDLLENKQILSFLAESESIDEFITKQYNFSVVKQGRMISSHIINARAFFVNSTLKEQLEKEYIKKNRFIGRFPIEPFVNEFRPTPHNINNSGFPRYRAFVHNEYSGFGVNPDWKKCFPFADKNITTYESKVEYDADGTKIVVTFPAEAQLYPGEYSLIIIGNIYDEGYSGNKRTVTIDQSKLFELVKTSEEAGITNNIEIQDNPVFIEITNSDSNLTPQDIYVTAGTYGDDAIKLSRNDAHAITVDVRPITGWYEGQ